jgi:hypothetical protein
MIEANIFVAGMTQPVGLYTLNDGRVFIQLKPHGERDPIDRVIARLFARPEHPLALFLDDLQWLDAATLDMLADQLTTSWSGTSYWRCFRPWQRLRRRKSATARMLEWPERRPRALKLAGRGLGWKFAKKSSSGLPEARHRIRLPKVLGSTGIPQ